MPIKEFDESVDSAPLVVERSGSGPAVLLLHGGFPASVTFAGQQELAERWLLIIPHRRGYPPSPPAARQDFLADADDVAELIGQVPGGAHLVGFSYGGLGLALVAERAPHLVRSLTLVEAPLWTAARDDDTVVQLLDLADRYAANPDDAETEREFHALAGVDRERPAGSEDAIRHALAFGRKLRSPRESDPDFDAIAAAGIPTLVVSGDHNPALERISDGLVARLHAQRAHVRGAGHAITQVPEFNAVLEAFLTDVEQRRREREATA